MWQATSWGELDHLVIDLPPRYQRGPVHAVAIGAAFRCRYRDNAAGRGARGGASWRAYVPTGRGADSRCGEVELLRLLAMRASGVDLRAQRRQARAREVRRTLLGRAFASVGHLGRGGSRPADRGRRIAVASGRGVPRGGQCVRGAALDTTFTPPQRPTIKFVQAGSCKLGAVTRRVRRAARSDSTARQWRFASATLAGGRELAAARPTHRVTCSLRFQYHRLSFAVGLARHRSRTGGPLPT